MTNGALVYVPYSYVILLVVYAVHRQKRIVAKMISGTDCFTGKY